MSTESKPPTCQWLCAEKNYDFCGKPARHRGKQSHSNYCLYHSARAPEETVKITSKEDRTP